MSIRKGSVYIAGNNISIDGDTISYNSNNSLQSVGNINKNVAVGSVDKLFDWVGTNTDYIAQDIETLHPEWICYITDDQGTGVGAVYNTAQADARFFKKNDDTDSTTISGLGMPSDRRDQLTLLASGSEYTAPANGWWYFTGQLGAGSGTSNQILMYERDFLEGNNLTARVLAPTATASYPAILPARAGSKLVLNYASTSASPNWLFFFHYAEGNPTNP